MDQQIVIACNHWAGNGSVPAYVCVLVAERGIFLLPLVFAGLWLWPGPGRSARRQIALACAIALAFAVVVVLGLDQAIYRPRPFVALSIAPLFAHAADTSFPSDHTLVGVSLVGPLLWRQPRLGVWLFLWALVVGFARVAAGVHYPSDIIVSAALASGPTILALLLGPFLVARLHVLERLVDGGTP